jgi:hypothetical protein
VQFRYTQVVSFLIHDTLATLAQLSTTVWSVQENYCPSLEFAAVVLAGAGYRRQVRPAFCTPTRGVWGGHATSTQNAGKRLNKL